VEALLVDGAVVGQFDKKGMSAAMLARWRGHVEVEERLLHAGDASHRPGCLPLPLIE